jgi:hypothetical protein
VSRENPGNPPITPGVIQGAVESGCRKSYDFRQCSPIVSFSKVDFSGLPKSSSTVRCGRDQAGGCARPADGGPFLFEGPVATEPKVRFSRSPRLGGFLHPASTTAELGGFRTFPKGPRLNCQPSGQARSRTVATEHDRDPASARSVGGRLNGRCWMMPRRNERATAVARSATSVVPGTSQTPETSLSMLSSGIYRSSG